jgi:hypothetical protein
VTEYCGTDCLFRRLSASSVHVCTLIRTHSSASMTSAKEDRDTIKSLYGVSSQPGNGSLYVTACDLVLSVSISP